MKTILQKIGPLYGEAVNGTVFGQPNGSDAVLPLSFVETPNAANYYVKQSSGGLVNTCDTNGALGPIVKIDYTAPVPCKLRLSLYADSSCSNLITYLVRSNGSNGSYAWSRELQSLGYTGTSISAGTTYYVRADLLYEGNVIKKGTVYPVVGV